MDQSQLETSSRVRNVGKVFQHVFGAAKYFGILLGLVAFGYVGHKTHWSFGSAKNHSESGEITHVVNDIPKEELITDGWEVRFPSEASLQRSGIKTSPIQQRTMRGHVKAVGVVTYDERMRAGLSARVSGTVWSVCKQPGDPVRRGDVLVIIDAAEVGKAKANFLSELVDVESKTEIASVLESVTGAVSGRQVREARVVLREAKIRLQNAEQTLVNLGLKVRKEAFEKLSDSERAAKLHFLGLPDSIVKELDHTQTTSNLLALTASFDGVLIRHDVATGEMVEAGKPVVEIADLRRMWLKLDVPKEDASKVTIGQRIQFTPDGLEREFDASITWISTEMNEQTRTLQIRAEVDNPMTSSDPVTHHEVRLLRANTFGTGTIELRETASTFAVPYSAVLHADNQPIVFVRTGDLSFARFDVKLGVREDQLVQVEATDLKPGMEIVTQGSHVLKSEWILNHVASSTP